MPTHGTNKSRKRGSMPTHGTNKSRKSPGVMMAVMVMMLPMMMMMTVCVCVCVSVVTMCSLFFTFARRCKFALKIMCVRLRRALSMPRDKYTSVCETVATCFKHATRQIKKGGTDTIMHCLMVLGNTKGGLSRPAYVRHN